MNVLSIRDFKAKFSSILKGKKEVLVTYRGEPAGIFTPVKEETLEKERARIGLSLLSLGESDGGKASELHDEVLYS